jgi:hypothetical protein
MSIPIRLSLALLTLTLAAPTHWAQATPSRNQAPAAQTSIIIERQAVRFTTAGEALEWQLVITNQQGEIIFDSGYNYGAALEWPLKNQQGEPVASGLYAYTLTSKLLSAETSHTQQGYLIVNRASSSDRVWMTSESNASLGANSQAAKLTVIGNNELVVGGAELPGNVLGRETSHERTPSPPRAVDAMAREKAAVPIAPEGTFNRVAKFGSDGTSLIDSAIIETGGNVGIGTTNPQSSLDYKSSAAPFFTRDVGTTNFGTAQAALQLGLSNLGARNVGVGPSFLFFGENSAGAKSFLGRVSGVWENPTAGAEAGAIFFQVRANSGDVSALTERMRITAAGNVGIGTASPAGLLHVRGANPVRILGDTTTLGGTEYVDFFARSSIYASDLGGMRIQRQGNGNVDTLIFAALSGNSATEKMRVSGNGNVGIGTATPVAKLNVEESSQAFGLFSRNSANDALGVFGQALGSNSTGVLGRYDGTSSSGIGVFGLSTAFNSNGVLGEANNGSAAHGVWGRSTEGIGVVGSSTTGKGVYGTTDANNQNVAGVHGNSGGEDGTGVFGEANSGPLAAGVWGRSFAGDNGFGVYGNSTGLNGTGVYGKANNGSFAAGIHGVSASGYAGFFSGNVFVTGDLSSFQSFSKIDHPLDPANKYLRHSSVESPDMKNIYDGVVTTDENGEATITLPDYFEALNRDFRYQLTVIGEFAQAIVGSKIKGQRFTIKTNKPYVEVSWQVTGIRQDAYAKSHRLQVEEEKPQQERGYYLHPKVFGQPEEKGLEWARRPELMRRMKEQREQAPPRLPKEKP